MIISKKPPYQNTEVDPEKTQSDINKLLRSYGVSVFQWTTDYDNNKIVLSMKVETPDQRKVYEIRMEPPTFAMSRKTYNPKTGKHERQDLPNWAASFRFLYNRVKVRLEEVAYGGSTVEQAFLSEIVVNTPTGKTTLYQALMDRQVLDKGFALEDKGEGEGTTVESVGSEPVQEATWREADST